MRQFNAAFFLVLVGAAPIFEPALAAELPGRKAGLWEMQTTAPDGRIMPMRQCIDAGSDKAMQSNVGQLPTPDCAKRDVQKSGDTTTVDSVCTVAGKSTTSHMVITGSFDSSYTMTITTQREGTPTARTMTMTSKWLGPCAADQKPGDMIMPNGTKMNILDMKRAGQPGAPPPPR